MDAKELKKLVKTMRENGVLKLKTAGIELELAPESLFPKKGKPSEPDTTPLGDIKMPKPLSEMDILTWSSRVPGEPEFEGEAPTEQ